MDWRVLRSNGTRQRDTTVAAPYPPGTQAARRAVVIPGHGSLPARLALLDMLIARLRTRAKQRRHQSLRDTSSLRKAKATLGSFVAYRARAARLPPRSAVSQVNTSKGTATPG